MTSVMLVEVMMMMMVVLLVMLGSQIVSRPPTRLQQHSRDVTALFSNDNRLSASPVSLRAAFASAPRYHRNTCPANLATAGYEGVVNCHRRVDEVSVWTGHSTNSPSLPAAAAATQPMFDAPALTEETLLDVSLCSAYSSSS